MSQLTKRGLSVLVGTVFSVAPQALWGIYGAIIYAAPRWVTCLVACRQNNTPIWGCMLEFVVALIVGAIAAAAFTKVAMKMVGSEDMNAISAMIGLLANPLTPALIKRASAVVIDKFPKAGDES